MGVDIVYNKLVITAKPKVFCSDLPKDVENNLKHEIEFIIKHNDLLAEHAIKYKLRNDIHRYKKQ